MAELVLYTNPWSRGAIVQWMLEELGVAYRTEVLAYGPAMKAPAYLAINPMGKVPAITHGDVVVTEAAAICAYLADAFPEAGMAPPPAERGAYYRWLFFASGPVEAAVSNQTCGFVASEEQGRQLGYGSLAAVVDALCSAVAGRKYVAADRFTAADVYVGSQIGWGMKMGTLPRRPELEAYWAGLETRPAQRKVMATLEAAIAERGDGSAA